MITPARAGFQASADPFSRTKFLLRQKHLVLGAEKFFVWDENGQEIFYVERPWHTLQALGALLAGLVAAVVVFAVFAGIASVLPDSAAPFAYILGAFGALAALLLVMLPLQPKRHLSFYASQSRGAPVLQVLQDQRHAFIVATFTVLDAAGQPIAKLRKNHLWNLLRRKWEIMTPGGEHLAIALEDSWVLAILRRFLGTLYGILRTNFIIVAPDGAPLGRLDRKFTILDRYVLDFSADVTGHFDRRVGLAIGMMLDTGERR